MSSSYKSFAVVGAGAIGEHIVKSLLSHNASTIILSRKSSKSSPDFGAQVFKVDYDDVASVTSVFKDHSVDVVISTLTHAGGLPAQYPIAEAAKAAGVKLFVPSEFGFVTEGATGDPEKSFLVYKNNFAQHLKAIGLPSARFYTGGFFSYVPWLTEFNVNGKINIIKKYSGTQQITWTADQDIGGFVAHVLTTLPAKDLEFKEFRLQGQRASFVEISSLLNKEIARVDELPEGGEDNKYKVMLLEELETGFGSTGWDASIKGEGAEGAGSANKLWPGHEWITLQQFYKTESK
ncbi:hypothetical protein C8J56DRAFT_853325 [Mycena floridula]|nr:hypothetical protein C8J56DRAFT_853325 [Mycena floridula]